MNKRIIWGWGLLLALALSFLAGAANASGEFKGLTISVSKTKFTPDEPVEFILVKRSAEAGMDDTPANLEGCTYIIEKNTEGDTWREFFTSIRNPFDITSLPLDRELKFTWNQKDNEGTHRAKPGQWRIRFIAPKGNIPGPLVASFQLLSPFLELVMAQTTYAQGEEVKFQVHNTGNNTADLEGCYYVIKHREGTQGQEFFTSRRNPFEVRSLDPDHKQGWTWDQWDNERQHKAPAGQWKLVFFAPKVAFSPVEVLFKIE